MDTAWAFRQAYEHARKLKQSQDEFCAKAKRGEWAGLGAYPDDLRWEALVDVLRGRVKVCSRVPLPCCFHCGRRARPPLERAVCVAPEARLHARPPMLLMLISVDRFKPTVMKL